jgi:hypothetical protein
VVAKKSTRASLASPRPPGLAIDCAQPTLVTQGTSTTRTRGDCMSQRDGIYSKRIMRETNGVLMKRFQ